MFGLYSLLGALGAADVLRQAAVRAAPEPAVPAIDRAVRAIGAASAAPRGCARPAARPPQPRAHGGVDRVLRADDRDRAPPTACTAATRCRSGSRPAPRTARRRASGCCASRRRTAATTPAGPATNWGGTTSKAGSSPPTPIAPPAYFSRACEARFQAGCVNLLDSVDAGARQSAALDLRLLLREGGPNLIEMPEPELYARACRHGWSFACEKAVGVAVNGAARLALVARAARARVRAVVAAPGGTRLAAPAARRARSGAARRSARSGFVEIPAGPFTMGADRSRSAAFDNERWSPSRPRARVERADLLHRPSRGDRRRSSRPSSQAHRLARSIRARSRARRPSGHVRVVARCAGLLPLARGGARRRRRGRPRLSPSGWARAGASRCRPRRSGRRRRAAATAGAYPWGDEPRRDRANFEGSGTTPVGQLRVPGVRVRPAPT